MIEIRDKNSAVRASVEITDKSVYSKVLMEEEYVLLSFESDVYIQFQKGDYIQTEFGVFRIVYIDKPTQTSSGGWLYEQRFHVDWERWRNHKVFYNRQKGSENAWKMTQTPEYFLDIICRNIQDAGYGRYSFEIDASLNEMKLIEFDGTNIIDGLTKVAETWETEWWIENRVIHISKCEYGTPVSLTENEEIGIIEPDKSSDTEHFTRAYVFGANRNLPKNYRKNDDGNIVIEGVVETRLKLPQGTPYIDAWPNMKDEDVVEGIIVLDEVYPRKVGTINSITTKEYTDTIEDENTGEKTYEKWNAFRFRDNDLAALKFSKEYVLPEPEELRIVFQTGKLAGMDFGVIFNPDNVSEKDSAAQIFEIVRNEDYGVKLPTDDFKPSVGDTYILYGYDTQFVYSKLVPEAEQELLEKGTEKLRKACQDKSVYTCPTNPIRCAGYTPNSTGRLNHLAANEIDLDVGQAVTLRSKNIDGGSRASRIRGFEKRLDNKFNATYTVGESSAYSRYDQMEGELEQLTFQSKQFVNVYGNSIYVVRRYDTAAPSDNNVPSFKRAQYEFLQKNVPDRALRRIIFDEGIDVGSYQEGEQGGRIDGRGNAELLSLVVRSMLRSPLFRNGMTGEGFRLWINEGGLAELELDRLTVRQIMTVFELVIDRIRSVGGQIIVSAANGKIKSVEDTGDAYIIKFDGDNYFMPHDLMRCQVFTGNDIRGYWVEIASSTNDSVTVSKSEFAEWGTEPREGDECVLMGNTQNPLRQNLISISATDDGQPRIDVLDGVNSKNFNDALRARLGNLDGINDSWFPIDNQPHGNGLYADNAYLRGTFLLTTGEDIKTKFEIVEGRIQSSVEGLRQDFMQDKGYLNNPTFGSGLDYWTSENDTVFFILGKKWIWANSNILSKKGDGASMMTDDGRRVVRIKNKYIMQKFSDLRGLPEIKTNEDGKKEPVPIYLSFFYKVRKAGTLKVGFENINNNGFIDYIPFEETLQLQPTETYQQMTLSGLWNATGDFKLSFTGEILVYMFVLSTDRIESLTYTYRTLFEQSEKLIRIAAENFDKDGKVLESSEIITSAKYNLLISKYFDENGQLINTAGLVTTANFATLFAKGVTDNGLVKEAQISAFITEDDFNNLISKVKIKADQIELEGLVTANQYFKILQDGSFEALAGKIAGFTISSNSITAEGGYSYSFDGSASSTSRFFLFSSGDGFLGFSDTYKWVGMGLNVMPVGSAVGSVLLRVQNSTPLEYYDNYGVLINVSGGLNNIGLLMYGDIRANARGYHVLNGHTYFNSNKPFRIAMDMNESTGAFSKYYEGVTFGFNDHDLDKVRFQVQNGIIVGVKNE